MKTIDRLLNYLKDNDIKPTVLEKELSISNGYLGKMASREGSVGSDVLEKIVYKFPNLDLNWLLTGNGQMLQPNILHEPVVYGKRNKKIADQAIPLYNFEASAGLVKLFSQHQQVLSHIQLPNMPRCDGAIYITGDSMYPILKSGDIVAYKQVDALTGILYGEMYLLSFDLGGEDMTSVKYLQRSELGPDHVKLVSHNQHHQPKDIPVSTIRALALVKISIRMQSMA